VIPFRIEADGVRVLLVSSRSGKRWVVPKGNLEIGLTPSESAGKEAAEEAGAVGFVDDAPVGTFRYRKRGRVHEVALYPMRVMRLRPVWDEMDSRQRVWVRAEEAPGLVGNEALGACLSAMAQWATLETAAA
jgi:phosphohistidine phosphatase